MLPNLRRLTACLAVGFAVAGPIAVSTASAAASTTTTTVTATSVPTYVPQYGYGKINAAVSPITSGQKLTLQRYYSGVWNWVAYGSTNGTATYSFGVNPQAVGVYSYRVVAQPVVAGGAAAISNTAVVRVYRVLISSIHYDALGNDFYNLNDEYVVIHNYGSVAISLYGFRLYAGDAGQWLTLPNTYLGAGANAYVRTGKGTNSGGYIYWQRAAPIWNNNGDTGRLYTPQNVLISTKSY